MILVAKSSSPMFKKQNKKIYKQKVQTARYFFLLLHHMLTVLSLVINSLTIIHKFMVSHIMLMKVEHPANNNRENK